MKKNRSRKAVAAARRAASARLMVPVEDRRSGLDRRGVPRESADRRVGPKTAAKMARVRIARDVDFLAKSVKRGDWAEVVRVASGIVGEVANFARAGAMLPLALLGPDLPLLTERMREAREPNRETEAERPVLLLHGWFHNRTGFAQMARRLRGAGRRHVFAIDMPTVTTTVQRMAQILDDKVDHVCALTGAKHVDMVAHSLGGLIARWWLHHEGGAKRLKHLVTLGAPHKGTALAAFVPIGSGKAVNVGSDVVQALDVPPPPGVKITSIWSDMDYLILPPENVSWHPREGNLRVRYVGHMSLLYSKRVFDEVWQALGGEP